MERVYEAVVYEIFNNNLGEEELEEGGNVEEEVKGASGLLRGLESHPEFSINPVFFATCAPLFINATVVIVYRYYREIMMILQKEDEKLTDKKWRFQVFYIQVILTLVMNMVLSMVVAAVRSKGPKLSQDQLSTLGT